MAKIVAQQVLNDVLNGLPQKEIARRQGCTQTAISKFLQRMQPHFQNLESLHRTRADLLAILHGKSLSIQDQMLDELQRRMEKKGFLSNLDLKEIHLIMKGVGLNAAVLFDKMRLERGESTENVGLAGMVKHFHEKVGFFDPSTGELREEFKQAKPRALPIKEDYQQISSQVYESIDEAHESTS